MAWKKLLLLAVSTGLAAKFARSVLGRGAAQRGVGEHKGRAVQRWEAEGGSPVTPAVPDPQAAAASNVPRQPQRDRTQAADQPFVD